MSKFQQGNRLISISTPLGDDVLALTSFSGREELSRLFSYQLQMISQEDGIAAEDVVGKNVTINIRLDDGGFRHFNGFVSQFTADYNASEATVYHAEVVPWLWFLTQTADCRIFQNKSIPEIIEQIFDDLGFSDFESSEIKGDHPKWEYCVQYRETDFNFVSRLMEQEGIFYYFRHEDKKHTLVLADHAGAYKDLPEKNVRCPLTSGTHVFEDHIQSWAHRYRFGPGKWAHTDYNFETPGTSLMAQTSSVVKLPGMDKYEIYDYPGEYEQKSDGETDVQIHMEEEEAAHDVVLGGGTCRTFTPGGRFTLVQHPAEAEQGQSYVITSIQHSAAEPGAYTTNGHGGHGGYSNRFTCIPDSVVFRPARTTPKPLVSGVQTAVVVGPEGEEIYCDEYGRVKVQFHWDREGKKDDESSCWIRVSHNVAGKQWGFMAIPRIGQEVVVDFLEGDPDRPLIVGSVYNAGQMPHYPLPGEKSKSYIKTNTTKGGSGYNELMFDDTKDSERLFLHAQKDMDVRVRNDSKSRIFGHRHQIVGWEKDGDKGGDQRERVYQDKHLNVKRNQVEHIEGSFQLMIGNGEADDGGQVDLVVEKNWNENIDGDLNCTVGGDRKTKIAGADSRTVGGNLHSKAGGDVALESGPMNDIHLKAGSNVTIEVGPAGTLTLKGMGGFITIGADGVTIQGIMVKINSGGAAGSGKGCQPEEPEEPQSAQPAAPAIAWNSKSGMKSSG